MTRTQMAQQTLTRDPVVLFQRFDGRAYECERCGSTEAECAACGEQYPEDRQAWLTERVFADYDQAEAWRAPQKYRYPDGDQKKRWRYYAVPCEGSLARFLRSVAEDEQTKR